MLNVLSLAVALAFPCANSLLEMYMMRTGPATARSRYRNPATLLDRGQFMFLPVRILAGYMSNGVKEFQHSTKAE